MEEEVHKKKASLISVVILFLILILITILFIKKLEAPDINSESLSLVDTDSKEYIASKKMEIDSYISSLNELYGINVLYGEDTINYANKVDATVETDLNIVNNNVKVLFHTLEKYPRGMFDVFKNKEYKMDVILLDSFTNNNLALASKNNLKEIKLYVSNTDKFERAVHHELFHVFEYYMADKNKYVFEQWTNLNPSIFKYRSDVLKLDNNYVYLKDSNTDNWYFVTKYAKTSEKEDRAETFAELMMLQKKPEYLESNTNIKKKADNIMSEMSKYLNVKNIYCDKFMK
mgnify:FL=1